VLPGLFLDIEFIEFDDIGIAVFDGLALVVAEFADILVIVMCLS
jgi:hypothetical protein